MQSDHHPEVPYGHELVANGYLVAAPVNAKQADRYMGVDDACWPIRDDGLGYGTLLGWLGVPEPLRGVRVSTIWDRTVDYWRRCVGEIAGTRLMLVTTRYTAPQVAPPTETWERLGFDVADPMGDHSIIWNEVLRPSGPPFASWADRLNGRGLFEELAVAEEFLRERSEAARRGAIRGMELSEGFSFVPVLVHLYTGS